MKYYEYLSRIITLTTGLPSIIKVEAGYKFTSSPSFSTQYKIHESCCFWGNSLSSSLRINEVLSEINRWEKESGHQQSKLHSCNIVGDNFHSPTMLKVSLLCWSQMVCISGACSWAPISLWQCFTAVHLATLWMS